MDNRCFKLKRSKCALVFQLFIFAVLMFLLYQLLPMTIWLVCGVIGLVICMKYLEIQQWLKVNYSGL